MYLSESIVRECLNEAETILKECCPEYHSPESITIEFTNANSFWAKIIKSQGGKAYRIRVSRIFSQITDPIKFKLRLLSTLIHELIHTFPGCMNHGVLWKEYAARVNCRYPELKISRTCSMKEYGIQTEKKTTKYIVRCTSCGREWKYQRKPNIWEWVGKNISPYTCPCGSRKFEGDQLR